MSQALAQTRSAGGLAIDIASLNSSRYWLVRVPVDLMARVVPERIFSSFKEVMAARAAVDPAPPIEHHPTVAVKRGDSVEVEGAGPGELAWIDSNGDVRVKFKGAPEQAEWYPISAIRRVVEKPRRAPFVFEDLQAGQAHRQMRTLGVELGALGDSPLALAMRRGHDSSMLGVIACARPSRRQVDDGLTLEIRGVVVAGDEQMTTKGLLTRVCRRAAEKGYRRLVVMGSTARQLQPALNLAGWDRILGVPAAGVSDWWVKVLRVAEVGV